jgi:hypothetical protein
MRFFDDAFGQINADILVANAPIASIACLGCIGEVPCLQMHSAFGWKFGHRTAVTRGK